MPWTSEHVKWLVDTGKRLKTVDGKTVEVWEFRHQKDKAVLSAWAKHFRNHYCLDTEIDILKPAQYTRSKYLTSIKFPDSSAGLGPGIRAGDFGEILVADYLQYLLGYWVPRLRWDCKDIRNSSGKGCDIMGFKILNDKKWSRDDILAIFEAKAQFSGSKAKPKLKDAVDGSAKDEVRKAESLNFCKQRLFEKQLPLDATRIARFQNPEDYPYKENYGAVALFSTSLFDEQEISKTDTSGHPYSNELILLVIRGNAMMDLVHELYWRAADEA
jgi:hypothetical protein